MRKTNSALQSTKVENYYLCHCNGIVMGSTLIFIDQLFNNQE